MATKKAQKAQMKKDIKKFSLCFLCLFVAGIAAEAQPAKQIVDDGLAAFDRGDTTAARAAFEKALTLKSDEVTAHTYLGIIADRAGDLKEAERHFAAAVKADPNRASVRNNYGAILMRTGRAALAAVEFEKSLKLDPDQPNALANLAQIRFATDDLHASAELFKRAFTIKPDAEIARALTVIALRLKDNPSASTYYEKYSAALAAESGTPAHVPAARAELGAGLFEAGLMKEAEAELSAAISLNPAIRTQLRVLHAFILRKRIYRLQVAHSKPRLRVETIRLLFTHCSPRSTSRAATSKTRFLPCASLSSAILNLSGTVSPTQFC